VRVRGVVKNDRKNYNYSALNLIIKIPLQKGLISIMLPHDSFLRFQLPFAKRDLKLSKKAFIPKYTE
jgi:hypothetical protein